MRFQAARDPFSDAVTWAYAHTQQNATLPILAGIHIEVDGAGDVTLSGFDYEASGQQTLHSETDHEPGRAVVPGRILADLVKVLPSAPVRVELADGATQVVLACGASRFEVPLLPVEDYPTLPDMPGPAGKVEAAALAAALARVGGIRARKDRIQAHPCLAATAVTLEPDELVLLSTDIYRAAMARVPWEALSTCAGEQVLIPTDFLAGIRKNLQGCPGNAVLAVDTGASAFTAGLSVGDLQGVSRLMAVDFPQVRRAVQALRPAFTIAMDTDELIAAVRRVATMLTDIAHPLGMRFESGALTLTASQHDRGSGSETVAHGLEDLEPMDILINPEFLLDGLNAVGDGTVHLQVGGPAKPLALTGRAPEPGTVPDFVYITQTIRKR